MGSNTNNRFKITAKASNDTDATSGKIIITDTNNNETRTIPAVIFTNEKAEKLLDLVEEVNTENRKQK